MTLIKPQLQEHVESNQTLIEGRLILTTIKIKSKCYKIANIYAPAKQSERKQYFREMIRYLEDKQNLILGGDFNTITDKADTMGIYVEQPYMEFLTETMHKKRSK